MDCNSVSFRNCSRLDLIGNTQRLNRLFQVDITANSSDLNSVLAISSLTCASQDFIIPPVIIFVFPPATAFVFFFSNINWKIANNLWFSSRSFIKDRFNINIH